MRRIRVGPIDALLLIICLAVVVANARLAATLTQDSLSLDGLRVSLEDETQNVRRLRTIDGISAPREELVKLREQLSSASGKAPPANVEQLQLVYGLLDFLPASAARIVDFRAQDVKTQTIDTVSFQLVGYQISMEGNPFDMLTLVRRVDRNELASLTLPSMALSRGEQGWSMKTIVVWRPLSAAQPTPVPTPRPTAPAGGRPTTTPGPVPAKP